MAVKFITYLVAYAHLNKMIKVKGCFNRYLIKKHRHLKLELISQFQLQMNEKRNQRRVIKAKSWLTADNNIST